MSKHDAHLALVAKLREQGREVERLTRDNPACIPYSPDGDADFEKLVVHPATETRQAFLSDRMAFADRLEMLEPAAWHRSGQHPQYERFDVHFQVEYMQHHEAHHLYQLFVRRAPLGKLPH